LSISFRTPAAGSRLVILASVEPKLNIMGEESQHDIYVGNRFGEHRIGKCHDYLF
jgi:hypothetical protein